MTLWLSLILCAAPIGPAAGAPSPSIDVARREVTFASGELRLAATLLAPAADKPVPALVIVHGSGDSDRSNAWTSAWAEALAARGFAVLHPDKRGSGESQGNWKSASFAALADDVQSAVTFLRAEPEVDRTQVGIAGFSQGVDVAPVCAARPGACDFVIAVSGSSVPFLEQILDEIELANKGAPLSAAQRGVLEALLRRALQ